MDFITDVSGAPVGDFFIAMNDSADVIGRSSFATAPFLRHFVSSADGSIEWLDDRPELAAISFIPKTIGDSGHLGGSGFDDVTGASFPVVVQPDGTVVKIPLPAPFSQGGISAINSSGEVAGWFSNWSGPEPQIGCLGSFTLSQVGFLWSMTSGLTIYTAPPTDTSCTCLYIADLTNSGTIVGTAARGVDEPGSPYEFVNAAFVEEANGVRVYYNGASEGGLYNFTFADSLSESGFLFGRSSGPVGAFGEAPFVIQPDGTARSLPVDDIRLSNASYPSQLNDLGELVMLDWSFLNYVVWRPDAPLIDLTALVASEYSIGFADRFALTNDGVTALPVTRISDGATGLARIRLTSCPADVNGDGLATPADFNAWILAFNAMAPECDQNGDGLCNPSDFNAWILNFNAGC